jgi:glucoamylase
MSSLAVWIEEQHRRSAAEMLAAFSPVQLLKARPGFGQEIRAVRGAIVASPVLAAYDPDPDYFFHWYRDSAIIIDALRLLFEEAVLGREALHLLADFITFSASLRELDGRALVESPAWRARIKPDFAQYVRSEQELAQVHGERVLAETRVNPDGTLDISRWGRPQNDGPALRALALLRWEPHAAADPHLVGPLAQLLRADLDFTARHGREPCFDIWEEESGLHYYTLCVSAAALEQGAGWLEARGEREQARAFRDEARTLLTQLDGYWLAEEGYYRSRVLESGARSSKELDVSVLLGVLHAGRQEGSHSVRDPKVHATLERLSALFAAEYPINRDLQPGRAPALGRYHGDVYYSGGAYYFATLAAAELCYRVGIDSLLRRGDAFLETVRAYTPPSGSLSEQFDRSTGEQTSAKQLAWSHAAFVSCVRARRACMAVQTTRN